MAYQAHRRQEPLSAKGILLVALLLAAFTAGLFMLASAMKTNHFFDGEPGTAGIVSTLRISA